MQGTALYSAQRRTQARRAVARRTGRVPEGEVELPDMDVPELQAVLKDAIASEVKTINVRLEEMAKALVLQTGSLGTRLDDLNHAADRRAQLEREDREQYVQAIEFKEFRNENGTWRAQIEKELRGYPRTTDVQQWVAVLQTKMDTLDGQVQKDSKRLDATQIEDEVKNRARQSQQWKLVAVVGFLSTILSGLMFMALNKWFAVD